MVADLAFEEEVLSGFVGLAAALPLLVGIQLYEHYGFLRGAAEARERAGVERTPT